MAARKTPRLGRGLSALMAQPVKIPLPPEAPEAPETPETSEASPKASPKALHSSAAKAVASTKTSSKTGKALQAATADKTAIPASTAASDDSKANAEPPGDADAAPAVSQDKAKTGQAGMAQAESDDDEQAQGGGLAWVAVEAIMANRHQPRRHFDDTALQQLAASITQDGLMQPVILRPARQATAGITHELVAGERRWRAAKLAGLTAVPAIVRDLDDRQSASWALVENLQREDLNPMERAEAFHHLVNQFKLSHEQIAQRVGVDRSTVSNLLRFIELDSQVQSWVRTGQISAGQARALAGLSDFEAQRALAQKAIAQAMSVRQVEQAVRGMNEAGQPAGQDKAIRKQARAAHLADLEEHLGKQLETKVRIRPGKRKGSGTLSIDFYSVDQFDTILQRLDVKSE